MALSSEIFIDETLKNLDFKGKRLDYILYREENVMFCKNCGNQIPDGVRFCPKCGKVTGAVLSNQSAINQNAANKNLMGHTATGKSTMDSDTIRSEKPHSPAGPGRFRKHQPLRNRKQKTKVSESL